MCYNAQEEKTMSLVFAQLFAFAIGITLIVIGIVMLIQQAKHNQS